jgi:hypothetical protein
MTGGNHVMIHIVLLIAHVTLSTNTAAGEQITSIHHAGCGTTFRSEVSLKVTRQPILSCSMTGFTTNSAGSGMQIQFGHTLSRSGILSRDASWIMTRCTLTIDNRIKRRIFILTAHTRQYAAKLDGVENASGTRMRIMLFPDG